MESDTPSRDTARAMSQENVEIVRRAIAALNEHDVDGYLELCAPNVELITPVSAIEGPFVGAQGISQFFAGIDEAMTEFHLNVTELRALDERRVLAVGQVRSVSKGGLASTLPVVNIYEIKGAKLRRIRVYSDQDEGLRAAGLSG